MDPKDLVTPHSTSEFYALVQRLTSHHGGLTTRAEVIAAELRHDLPKASGKMLASLRPDLKFAAWQISRCFTAYGASNQAGEKAVRRAWSIFNGTFNPGASGGGKHGGGFDLDR